MNWKQILFGLVLLDFSALTAYAVYEHGYAGFFELVFANSASITLFVDLLIALSLVGLWMWQDARERGTSVLPYLLLTLTLGSVGPLLYLVVRSARDRAPSPHLARPMGT